MINDKIPAAINGPTGTPPKKATPKMVPINNPVTNVGEPLIKETPLPLTKQPKSLRQ